MKSTGHRAALSAFPLAFIALVASCWMPSFDPALSLSIEMDAFFERKADAAWRSFYSLAIGQQDDSADVQFLPFRMSPGTAGGFLVWRSPGYLKVTPILQDGTGWILAPTNWGDGSVLGMAALVGPMDDSMTKVFVYRDPGKGLESVDAYGGVTNTLLDTALTEGRRLLGLGSWTDSGGATRFGEILVGTAGDAHARRGTVDASFLIDIAPDELIDTFSLIPSGPGFAMFDLPTSTFYFSPKLPDPRLWSAKTPGISTALAIAGLESPATGLVHGALDQPVFLASGKSFTDFYSASGARLGWLPTGSWRFAFEWWDMTGLRWISVFTRFALLTDTKNDEENRAFAQVEGVPTADLLAFAAEKLGK